MIAEMGTPEAALNDPVALGHWARGTVKREFGCAAGAAAPLAVHLAPRQSSRNSSWPSFDIPSHHTVYVSRIFVSSPINAKLALDDGGARLEILRRVKHVMAIPERKRQPDVVFEPVVRSRAMKKGGTDPSRHRGPVWVDRIVVRTDDAV
jgi:hypothetical protein